MGQQSPKEANGILERKIQEEVIVLQPWSPHKWAQLDGNRPGNHVLSRKKASVLHLKEMVTAWKIQGTMGKGWGWEDSHDLDLFFMTPRVRMGTRGWEPSYGFELGMNLLSNSHPPEAGMDVSGGTEFCSWRGSSRVGDLQCHCSPCAYMTSLFLGKTSSGSCPSLQSCG